MCDDFDVLEQVPADRGGTIVEPTEWQVLARQTYDFYELPTSRAKAGIRKRRSERLGYEIDGDLARLGGPGHKLGRLIGLTRHVIEEPVRRRHFR
eukprot:1802621-Amphidinium_carterae.3